MAVSIADIKKLRELTQAGMGDCKKALEESNGDFDAAVKWIREKFTKIAAKREAREAAQGVVIARTEGNYGAVVALKCETESVANNDKFQALAVTLTDLVMANKPANNEALLALPLEEGTVQSVITERSGACGEKMEVVFEAVEGASVVAYNHFNHMLSTVVAFNLEGADEEALKEVACQVAAMNPMAVNADEIPQAKKDEELELAIKKTKEEMLAEQDAKRKELRKSYIDKLGLDGMKEQLAELGVPFTAEHTDEKLADLLIDHLGE